MTLVPVSTTFPVDIIEPAYALAERLASTEFVPKSLQRRPEAVLACILAGNEVGLGPMASLAKISIIEGKPAVAPEAMRALVQSRGHRIWTEKYSATEVTVCGQRAGEENVERVTWEIADARRAGLAGKQNWQRYPRAMLLARATGELCRLLFADVLGGVSYTPEELDDDAWVPPAAALEEGAAERGSKAIQVAGQTVADTKAAAAPAAAAPTRRRATATPRSKPAEKAVPAARPQPPLPDEDDDVTDVDVVEDQAGEPASKMSPANEIAMVCKDAEIVEDDERHAFIRLVTGGRVESGHDVTPVEHIAVLQLARAVGNGDLLFTTDAETGVPVLLDAAGDPLVAQIEHDGETLVVRGDALDPPAGDEDPAEDDGGVPDDPGWSSRKWTIEAQERGVTRTQLIEEARRIAYDDLGSDSPASLDDALKLDGLAGRLYGWLGRQQGSAAS